MKGSIRVNRLIVIIGLFLASIAPTYAANSYGEYDSAIAEIHSNASLLISNNKLQIMSQWGNQLNFYYNNLKAFHQLMSNTMRGHVQANSSNTQLRSVYQSFLLMSKEVRRLGLTIHLNNDYSINSLFEYNQKVKGCYDLMVKGLTTNS